MKRPTSGKVSSEKIFVITSIVIGVIAGLYLLFAWLRPFGFFIYAELCRTNLIVLSQAATKYAVEHDGVMPASWKVLVDEGLLEAEADYWKCIFDKRLRGKPSYSNTSYSALFGRDMKVEKLDTDIVFHKVEDAHSEEIEYWPYGRGMRITVGLLEKIKTGDSDIKNAIKMLSSRDSYTRQETIETLQELGADDHGYDPLKEPEENQEAIEKLEEWANEYVKQKKTQETESK